VAEAVAWERRKAKERARVALERARVQRRERVAAERAKWRKLVCSWQETGTLVVKRDAVLGQFLVAARAVGVQRGRSCTPLGRSSKVRRGAVLLLRETIGDRVIYSKTERSEQRRAERLLAVGEAEAGQAREVLLCGGRWYCTLDLVSAGSVVMLAAQFVHGRTGNHCNGKITAVLRHGERTLRLWAVRSVGQGECVVVSYGGSAGRRVVALF
jgi:hypothetical protein